MRCFWTLFPIVPPPEIRSIVEKTASFVARNGEQFEQKIKQNEMNNSKFNFLKEEDPYHLYYKKKVKDFSEGTATLTKQAGELNFDFYSFVIISKKYKILNK